MAAIYSCEPKLEENAWQEGASMYAKKSLSCGVPKLGIRVSPRTVRKYMPVRPPGHPRGDQRWSTFLRGGRKVTIGQYESTPRALKYRSSACCSSFACSSFACSGACLRFDACEALVARCSSDGPFRTQTLSTR